MLKALLARLRQGRATIDFPSEAVRLPDRFRGLPVIDQNKCGDGCQTCAEACPTDAISVTDKVRLDLGRCLFCGLCAESCPTGAIRYTQDFRLAVRKREDLILGDRELKLAEALNAKLRRLFGRSLKLRQVSAGGCNGCEVEVNATENIVFDLGRFGIQMVASPRHADGLLITGPVTENMKLALQKTYEAVPDPRLVIAVGACAISGGPYFNRSEQENGADSTVPVDLYIPGCPPHPLTILDGLLRLMGRIEKTGGSGKSDAEKNIE